MYKVLENFATKTTSKTENTKETQVGHDRRIKSYAFTIRWAFINRILQNLFHFVTQI